MGQTDSNVSKVVQCTIHSKHNVYTANLECLVLNEITKHLPSISIDTSRWQFSPTISLADVNFDTLGPMDMLVGAELFCKILCIGQIRPHKDGLLLQKTIFGWVSSEKINAPTHKLPLCHFTMEKRVDAQLQQFWEIKDLPSNMNEKEHVSELFTLTIRSDHLGHYTVNLPLKDNVTDLEDSKKVAETRFLRMESQLKRITMLYKAYSELVPLVGHMEKVQRPSIDNQ